jgi:hypothetical protein
VKPWVALGSLTELDGKVKASGKTTLVTHMIRCNLDGLPFLGEPTLKTPVVMLTEQGDNSLTQALKRAGLLERDDLHLLSWHQAVGISWETVVDAAIQKCLEVGAKFLCVDTLPQFAGIEGDGENLSGEALRAIAPLKVAADRHGLGVIFTRHERKSGGEVGDSGRGSSAFAGGADIVLSLRRREGGSLPNARVIHSLSRYDETPSQLVIELREGTYVVLGEEANLAIFEARKLLQEHLPTIEDHALTLEELLGRTGVGRTTLQKALNGAVEDREASKKGKGVRGDPVRYWLA